MDALWAEGNLGPVCTDVASPHLCLWVAVTCPGGYQVLAGMADVPKAQRSCFPRSEWHWFSDTNWTVFRARVISSLAKRLPGKREVLS